MEYAKFNKTKNIVYLQQAGEKLFNAIESYIQYKRKVNVDSFYELKNLATKSQKKLLYKGRELHRFFYNGLNEYDIETAERKYLKLYKQLKNKTKKNPRG